MNATDTFAYRPARWPAVVVAGAILVGLAMLVAAALLYWRSAAVLSELDTPAPTQAGGRPSEGRGNTPLFALVPSATSRFADLRMVYELAGEKHVALASVEYRSETQPKAGLLLEHMDLRLEDEYPNVKLLLAELLRALPNLMVDEIDIQNATSGTRIQATIRLTLVYLAGESEPKSVMAVAAP